MDAMSSNQPAWHIHILPGIYTLVFSPQGDLCVLHNNLDLPYFLWMTIQVVKFGTHALYEVLTATIYFCNQILQFSGVGRCFWIRGLHDRGHKVLETDHHAL